LKESRRVGIAHPASARIPLRFIQATGLNEGYPLPQGEGDTRT